MIRQKQLKKKEILLTEEVGGGGGGGEASGPLAYPIDWPQVVFLNTFSWLSSSFLRPL